jgi:hypothetical protein
MVRKKEKNDSISIEQNKHILIHLNIRIKLMDGLSRNLNSLIRVEL